jgi:hypothetical protein
MADNDEIEPLVQRTKSINNLSACPTCKGSGKIAKGIFYTDKNIHDFSPFFNSQRTRKPTCCTHTSFRQAAQTETNVSANQYQPYRLN